MLRDGHVRVTCGADQQPPAFFSWLTLEAVEEKLGLSHK